MKKGKLFIISGPSGVGKNTVTDIVKERMDNLEETVSMTSRNMRENEIHGVHYYYVSKEEFEENIKNDMFLEWALFVENYYGTLKSEMYNKLDSGINIVSVVEVQGAAKLIDNEELEAVSIFILPPSFEELERRITTRSRDSKEYIEKRLNEAKHEISLASNYDYNVVNNTIENTVNEIMDIILKHTN